MNIKRTLFILFLVNILLNNYSQITDFEFDTSAYLCDSVDVQFTDLSVNPTSHKWYRNGDSVSNVPNPVIRLYAGIDTITLVINNNPTNPNAVETKYIQVAFQQSVEKVREREFGHLLKINDNYEKIVVSADEFATDFKGIRHMHIREFLVEG